MTRLMYVHFFSTAGYNSEMTMRTQDIPVLPDSREKCTLPSWCIYIAYVLCFLLCAFSIVLVILYCFKFGYEESLEWVLALIFALFQSFLLIEPVKVGVLPITENSIEFTSHQPVLLVTTNYHMMSHLRI